MLGIYWAYSELVHIDVKFWDKVSIFLIVDGIDKLSNELLEKLAKTGIYNDYNLMGKAFSIEDPNQEQYLEKLCFPQEKKTFFDIDLMKNDRKKFASDNCVHVFSKELSYKNWRDGWGKE